MPPNTRVSPDWRSRQLQFLGRVGGHFDKLRTKALRCASPLLLDVRFFATIEYKCFKVGVLREVFAALSVND